MPKTVHFEGISGAGKSSASQRLKELLLLRGIEAAWWLEESADHPITPKDLRARHRDAHFPTLCLDAWSEFLRSNPSAVTVLDGYAFQSTIRFLFERQVSRDQIDRYFLRWQDLAPDTTIVYFRVEDPLEHAEIVLSERGEDWADKLYAWVERTPVGVASKLRGKSGFVSFWSAYQELCLELLATAFVHHELMPARSWSDQALEDLAIRCGLLPQLGADRSSF